MATTTKQSQQGGEALHRGRIQAQGGGTYKSVSWAKESPPTISEMLQMCDDLEKKLTSREKRDRKTVLDKIRKFITSAGQTGGVQAPISKSKYKPGSGDIRVDLEVHAGMACVPEDTVEQQNEGGG